MWAGVQMSGLGHSAYIPGLWLVTCFPCWPLIGWWWPGLTRRGPGKITQHWSQLRVAQWTTRRSSSSLASFCDTNINKTSTVLRMWTVFTLILPLLLSAHRQPYKRSNKRYHQNVNQREAIHGHVSVLMWNHRKLTEISKNKEVCLIITAEAPVGRQWSHSDIPWRLSSSSSSSWWRTRRRRAPWQRRISQVGSRAVSLKYFHFITRPCHIFVKNVPLAAHISTRGW